MLSTVSKYTTKTCWVLRTTLRGLFLVRGEVVVVEKWLLKSGLAGMGDDRGELAPSLIYTITYMWYKTRATDLLMKIDMLCYPSSHHSLTPRRSSRIDHEGLLDRQVFRQAQSKCTYFVKLSYFELCLFRDHSQYEFIFALGLFRPFHVAHIALKNWRRLFWLFCNRT